MLAALVACAAPAQATYSIVGSHLASRQLGGAGTSCLGGSDVSIIYAALPAVGAIHAQASYSRAGRERGLELLRAGRSPSEILSELTAPAFDARALERQYAVIDVQGRVASFTGSEAMSYASDLRGRNGDYVYAVQGNLLTSSRVLSQAAAGFERAACDLAERLMNALEAGAENGEGDNRCARAGIPGDSAFIQVEAPDSLPGAYLALHVPTSGSDNPLLALRVQFDAWRVAHPCPTRPEPPREPPREPSRVRSGRSGCTATSAPGPSSGAVALLLAAALVFGSGRRRHRTSSSPAAR